MKGHYYFPRQVSEDPRQMPELRRALLDFGHKGGPWERAEMVRSMQDMIGTYNGKADDVDLRAFTGPKGIGAEEMPKALEAAQIRGVNAMTWYRDGLERAQLMHVSPEMCEVLFASEQSIPPDTVLHEDMLPTPSGFCVFGQPFTGIDSGEERDEIRVDAVLWHPVRLPPRDEYLYGVDGALPGIAMAAFRYMDAMNQHDQMANEEMGGGNGQDSKLWLPLGRADWLFDDTIEKLPHEGLHPGKAHDSMMEDRRLHAALWSLIQQKRLVTRTAVLASKPARKRLDRQGDTTSREVEVIHLRRPEYRPLNADGSTGRKIGVRFTVRPHWRNQPYGKDSAKRKLILIPPHWKGDPDAPIQHTERVWSLDS
jgi:hypothetical protein